MSKTNIWIIVIVFVVLVAAFVFAYHRGKKNAEGPKVTYPQGGSTLPAGWDPVPLAKELHDAMSGLFTFSGTKDDAWKKLRDLPNDEMIISVYSVFNQKYFSDGKGTLTDWIKDEYYYDATSGVKESVLNELAKLKLE